MQLPFMSDSNQPAKAPQSEKLKQLNPNRIRDHLANERTYLSWMRSGIALMGFGVLIVRIRMLRPPMAPQMPGKGWRLGLAFSIVGLLSVLLSTQHYFAVRNDIEEDTYEPPDRWVIMSSLAVLLLGLGVVYYIFAFPAEMAGLAILE
jgi:putative membrane protein